MRPLLNKATATESNKSIIDGTKWKNLSALQRFKNVKSKVNVTAIGLIHNFIILANGANMIEGQCQKDFIVYRPQRSSYNQIKDYIVHRPGPY